MRIGFQILIVKVLVQRNEIKIDFWNKIQSFVSIYLSAD